MFTGSGLRLLLLIPVLGLLGGACQIRATTPAELQSRRLAELDQLAAQAGMPAVWQGRPALPARTHLAGPPAQPTERTSP
jgi:hypothetical protein